MSKLFLTMATAIALVSAPAFAAARTASLSPAAQVQRASPTGGESAMEGNSTYLWIGAGILALIILFVVLDDDDEDLPTSP